VTCPFSEHKQSCKAGWSGHPEKKVGDCSCKQKFYRTEIKVVVLSEEPFDHDNLSLGDVRSAVTYGGFKTVDSRVLTEKQAAMALKAQGSDPEFFQIRAMMDRRDAAAMDRRHV
jgi:hypothetical protein